MLKYLSSALLLVVIFLDPAARAADELPILFQEDFEKDASHWQPFDAKQWKLKKTEKGSVFSQHDKETTYKPPHRSPTNVALLKDVVAGDFDLTDDSPGLCQGGECP